MLKINSSSSGNFIPNNYVIGTSDVSKYFPIINFESNERIDVSQENFIKLYHKPSKSRYSAKFNRTSVIDDLNSYTSIKKIVFSKTGESDTVIFLGKGYVADENDNILLMLASKVPYFTLMHKYDSIPNEEQSLFIEEKMVLLLSTELVTNKKYAIFYKFLQKDYIEDAYGMKLDVIYTTSEKIEKKCYSNTFSLEFNRVEDLINHLINVVPEILYKNDEYFNTMNPGLRKQVITTRITEDICLDVNSIPNTLNTEKLLNTLHQESVEHINSISNIRTGVRLVGNDYVYSADNISTTLNEVGLNAREHYNSYIEEFDLRHDRLRGTNTILDFELIDDTEQIVMNTEPLVQDIFEQIQQSENEDEDEPQYDGISF